MVLVVSLVIISGRRRCCGRRIDGELTCALHLGRRGELAPHLLLGLLLLASQPRLLLGLLHGTRLCALIAQHAHLCRLGVAHLAIVVAHLLQQVGHIVGRCQGGATTTCGGGTRWRARRSEQ